MYLWTSLPIKLVLVGSHVRCLLRDRRRAPLFLPCTGRLISGSCVSGKTLVFDPRHACQVLQIPGKCLGSQGLNPGKYREHPHSRQYHNISSEVQVPTWHCPNHSRYLVPWCIVSNASRASSPDIPAMFTYTYVRMLMIMNGNLKVQDSTGRLRIEVVSI